MVFSPGPRKRLSPRLPSRVKLSSHHIYYWGLYEWVRIPSGLSSAPAEFQRSMEECLTGPRDEICLPYLDDYLVHSTQTFEDHLKDLTSVLRSYQCHGVKLTSRKCEIFKNPISGEAGRPRWSHHGPGRRSSSAGPEAADTDHNRGVKKASGIYIILSQLHPKLLMHCKASL